MEYDFKATNIEGKKINGTREAASASDLARGLREEGYFLTSSREKNSLNNANGFEANPSWVSNLNLIFKRVSLQEKMIFARHLSLLIHAGFSLNKALDTLSRQTLNLYFSGVLKKLSSEISAGKTFYESAVNSKIFSSIFLSMVKIGEASGKLEETLKLAAMHLKREHALKRRIKNAMIYPVLIILAMGGIGFVMSVFVLPQLSLTLAELNTNLPLSTRIIFGAGTLLSRFWYLALVLFVGGGYLVFLSIRRTDRGKKFVNWLLLKTPILSDLTKKINSARFARTLSSLLSSGVSLSESLKVTSESLTNYFYKRAVGLSLAEVEKGKALSSFLAQDPDLFPPVVTEMIAVGEESGSLTAILNELALFYEGEVAVATKGLSSVIEPVIMIVIGAAVGAFALAVIQPIYAIINNL